MKQAVSILGVVYLGCKIYWTFYLVPTKIYLSCTKSLQWSLQSNEVQTPNVYHSIHPSINLTCDSYYTSISLWNKNLVWYTNASFSENGFKKQENNDTRISPSILVLSCWTILFWPIEMEKQNFTLFLLVVIKLLIKKTKKFFIKLLFSCFHVF